MTASARVVPTTPVVAVCQGHRCRALLAGQEPDGMGALREAARASHRGILVSTACAGPCSYGPVVTVGAGRHVDGRLSMTARALLGPVRTPHVAALGRYLQASGSPGLPEELADVRLLPRRAGRAS